MTDPLELVSPLTRITSADRTQANNGFHSTFIVSLGTYGPAYGPMNVRHRVNVADLNVDAALLEVRERVLPAHADEPYRTIYTIDVTTAWKNNPEDVTALALSIEQAMIRAYLLGQKSIKDGVCKTLGLGE